MYRPKNFDELVGQEVTVKELKKLSQTDSIPHVSILTGDTGVGKTTTAFILAAALNCKHKVNGNPCGDCPSCRDIFTENFGRSCMFLDASAMGKEDVVGLAPKLEGGSLFRERKVVIIDEAQELSSKAFGACLRMLESVQENLYFILCTMRPLEFDRAVLSRCTTYNFTPLSFDEILQALAAELKRRGIFESIPEVFIREGVMTIAENSHGSVRESIQHLDRALASELYTTEQLEKELGLVEASSTRELLSAYLGKNVLGFLTAVRRLNSKSLWSGFAKILAEVATKSVAGETLYSGNHRLIKADPQTIKSGIAALSEAMQTARALVGYDASEVITGCLMSAWFFQHGAPAVVAPAVAQPATVTRTPRTPEPVRVGRTPR